MQNIYRKRIGAICKDGTLSSTTGRGACSHHGGVQQWIYEQDKKKTNKNFYKQQKDDANKNFYKQQKDDDNKNFYKQQKDDANKNFYNQQKYDTNKNSYKQQKDDVNKNSYKQQKDDVNKNLYKQQKYDTNKNSSQQNYPRQTFNRSLCQKHKKRVDFLIQEKQFQESKRHNLRSKNKINDFEEKNQRFQSRIYKFNIQQIDQDQDQELEYNQNQSKYCSQKFKNSFDKINSKNKFRFTENQQKNNNNKKKKDQVLFPSKEIPFDYQQTLRNKFKSLQQYAQGKKQNSILNSIFKYLLS